MKSSNSLFTKTYSTNPDPDSPYLNAVSPTPPAPFAKDGGSPKSQQALPIPDFAANIRPKTALPSAVTQGDVKSAAAVFPAKAFAKKFIKGFNDQSDVLQSCSRFLSAIRMGRNDAGIIMDDSGGLIWFTSKGLKVLEGYNTFRKQNSAALRIQKVWKGYSVRKKGLLIKKQQKRSSFVPQVKMAPTTRYKRGDSLEESQIPDFIKQEPETTRSAVLSITSELTLPRVEKPPAQSQKEVPEVRMPETLTPLSSLRGPNPAVTDPAALLTHLYSISKAYSEMILVVSLMRTFLNGSLTKLKLKMDRDSMGKRMRFSS